MAAIEQEQEPPVELHFDDVNVIISNNGNQGNVEINQPLTNVKLDLTKKKINIGDNVTIWRESIQYLSVGDYLGEKLNIVTQTLVFAIHFKSSQKAKAWYFKYWETRNPPNKCKLVNVNR
jgi:hypothetical protein